MGLTDFFVISSTDYQSSIRIPWLLPGRAKFVGLQLYKIFAFVGCCVCYVCGEIYNPAEDASVGKS